MENPNCELVNEAGEIVFTGSMEECTAEGSRRTEAGEGEFSVRDSGKANEETATSTEEADIHSPENDTEPVSADEDDEEVSAE